jgi:two-component system response regulator RegA
MLGGAWFESTPVRRLQWEYIQKVLVEHDGNICKTARVLGYPDARTLHRKLTKRPSRT